MCQTESTADHAQPGFYEIRVQGYLEARWTGWFEEMTIVWEENGETSLRGPMADQATLHGLLRKVRDLGMPLNSVTRISRPPADDESRPP